ncbi:hypothetical protein G9C98_002983 [Cotesia typhae]|uniref:Uncharacterized protein n=1 Tax=Cotesia typhae TaxID=2053667 RepID=A0A8J5QX04_9HYME|nr:hypothetical protein G9C98_002983 [Cotesia typhae]
MGVIVEECGELRRNGEEWRIYVTEAHMKMTVGLLDRCGTKTGTEMRNKRFDLQELVASVTFHTNDKNYSVV